jgi:hypothetical protein
VDHVLLFDNNEDGGKQAMTVRDFIEDGWLTSASDPQVTVYNWAPTSLEKACGMRQQPLIWTSSLLSRTVQLKSGGKTAQT